MAHYLSKSDFKLAQGCPTKLYYKKLGYPTTSDENDYLQLLADGGYMVETIAKLLFPAGRDLMPAMGQRLPGQPHPSEIALQETLTALAAEQVILFEATLCSNGKLARVDILDKQGDRIDLIEVKSKSYSSIEHQRCLEAGQPSLFRGKKGKILAAWQPYLEDVAFQVLVLQEVLPNVCIRPFLLMPDKAKTTTIDLIHSLFQVRHVTEPGSNRKRTQVEFTGDPDRLRRDHFLTLVDVAAEVDELLPQIRIAAQGYVDSLHPALTRIAPSLAASKCKACEFRATATDDRSGFRDCWGSLADPSPHLLELGYISDTIADPLIQQGITSLVEIPLDCLVNKDGSIGDRNQRQRLQITHTRANTEWVSAGFPETLQAYPYPLHFIDFETSALAVPYHAGMHPYETVAFQWSCHTLRSPTTDTLHTDLIHADWLNLEDYFPNFQFAQSLMQHLQDQGSDGSGNGGTVFMWASHEQTILRKILQQMQTQQHHNPPLQQWLEEISTGRLVDMRKLAEDHYFHPLMQGKTSIKVVLEAVWQTNATLRSHFPHYIQPAPDGSGEILSPYQALPALTIAGEPITIVEGTGAMRAYQAMLYGAERQDPTQRQQWAQLLRQYCHLDTLAMVMIWHHWCTSAKPAATTGYIFS